MPFTASIPLMKRPGDHFKQRLLRVEAKDTLPITLRHERIYILPTKRGLAFIMVIMVMLLASMNYGLNLGYALSFMMIGLFASCLLSTYLNIARLRLLSASATDTFANEPIEFCVTLEQGRQTTRHSISLSAEGAHDQIDTTAGNSNKAVLRIPGRERGVAELGRITLSSDFPLGLWRGWGYVHTPVTAYVYPMPEKPAPELVSQNSGPGGNTSRLLGEQEYKQLKRYQKTDSPGSVAWKQVAKGGDWYSKEFEPEQTNKVTSIKWTDTSAYASAEQRLSTMCARILIARAENLSYGLELPGISVSAKSGQEHAKNCLRLLATFRPA